LDPLIIHELANIRCNVFQNVKSRLFDQNTVHYEARIWQEFLDWIGDPDNVVIYCWSSYEFGKLRQAATDHPALAPCPQAVEAALVDQKEQIKHRPYFPVSSYSIKSVAPVCGFYWSQDDVDGQTAQLMHIDWLRMRDDTIIRKVEQYNREDVLAMLAVDRYVDQISHGD